MTGPTISMIPMSDSSIRFLLPRASSPI